MNNNASNSPAEELLPGDQQNLSEGQSLQSQAPGLAKSLRGTAAGAILLALAGTALPACDDGGGYDLIPGPGCTSCDAGGNDAGQGGTDGGGLQPGEGGSDAGIQCKKVPQSWDLRDYKGCMTDAQLAGVYRNANHQEYAFEGKPFVDNNNGKQGELFYLKNPSADDCGPMEVAAVSNSGSIQYSVSEDVDFYLVNPPLAEVVWQKLHNGQAPTEVEMLSGNFSSLLLDIFECEKVDTNCALKSTIPGGWPTDGSMVDYQLTGPNATADGSYCGWMFTVMQSK